MKKFTFLFSLLLTQFAFAQWDGDFPGDGTFPSFGDSIVVVNDSTIVINGDTIIFPGGGNDFPGDGENPWDNDWDDNDPWDNEGWGNGSWDDSMEVDFPWDDIEVINDSTIVIGGDTIMLPGGNGGFPDEGEWPWGDSTDVENPWEDEVEIINDSTIVIGGDTITLPGGNGGFPGEGEWPWDDSTDVDESMIVDCNGIEGPADWIGDGYCDDGSWGIDFNCEQFDFDGGDCEEGEDDDEEWPWDDEWDDVEVINDSTIVIDGDTITFPGDGEWPWDDNDWDDEDECPWEDGFPGGSENDGFDEDTFEDVMEIIEGFDMEADELILILEETDAVLSILDESGFEFTPEEVDGYLVFGPFSLDELYSILIEGMEGFEIGWGLFRPAGAQVVGEGVISSTEDNINGMFDVSSMLSLNETVVNLEVYKTTYYDLLGKEIKEAANGVFIKVMQTNKGEISSKVYLAR